MYALARLIQKHSRFLAVLETIDNGKPIRETRDIYINLVARHFYYHAGWAAKLNKQKKIDVWGDGEQTRSFLYIDDCIEGTETVFARNFKEPLNIGSEEQVSINQMINMIEEIADYRVEKNYQLDKPKGV